MIDELEILKTIISDLSNVGIWGVAAYIAYKLIKLGMILGALIYAVKKLYQYFINPDRSNEIKNLKQSLYEASKDKDLIVHKHKMELEDIKHMYKILKESKDDDKS